MSCIRKFRKTVNSHAICDFSIRSSVNGHNISIFYLTSYRSPNKVCVYNYNVLKVLFFLRAIRVLKKQK